MELWLWCAALFTFSLGAEKCIEKFLIIAALSPSAVLPYLLAFQVPLHLSRVEWTFARFFFHPLTFNKRPRRLLILSFALILFISAMRQNIRARCAATKGEENVIVLSLSRGSQMNVKVSACPKLMTPTHCTRESSSGDSMERNFTRTHPSTGAGDKAKAGLWLQFT